MNLFLKDVNPVPMFLTHRPISHIGPIAIPKMGGVHRLNACWILFVPPTPIFIYVTCSSCAQTRVVNKRIEINSS